MRDATASVQQKQVKNSLDWNSSFLSPECVGHWSSLASLACLSAAYFLPGEKGRKEIFGSYRQKKRKW